MQDKVGIFSIGWGSVTAVYGLVTWQEIAAIVGIAGVAITTGVKVWESRKKVEIERKAAEASRQADNERAGYWSDQRRRKHRRREGDPDPEDC